MSKKKDNRGRPHVLTKDVLAKLEDAFMNAFTDKMACLYAGISEATLYRYCEENPEFRERKEALKESPNLVAQKTLVTDLTNVGGARWWAEHKMPDFMPKSKVEHSGQIKTGEGATDEAAKKVATKYEAELRETIVNQRKGAPAK